MNPRPLAWPLLLAIPGAAEAATLQVGPTRPWTDLQDALDDANDGDIVVLDPGTYNGAYDVRRNVILRGHTAQDTQLSGDADRPVLTIAAGRVVIVERLTLRDGERGLRVDGAAVTLDDVDVRGNGPASAGGGLYAAPGSVVAVRGGTWANNTADQRGGHLAIDGSSLTLDGVTWVGGLASDGGALWIVDSDAEIRSVHVQDAVANGAGGAFLVDDDAHVVLHDTVFLRNEAIHGGAIAVLGDGATVDATGTQWIDNRADQGGAVYLAADAAWTTRGVWLAQHTTDGDGAAVYLSERSSWSSTDDWLSDNQADVGEGGAARVVDDAWLSWSGTTLAGNSADRGGALSVASRRPSYIDHARFTGNLARRGGGAIALSPPPEGALFLSRSHLTDNRAWDTVASGGALLARSGALQTEFNAWFDNDATTHGGAVASDPGVTLALHGDRWCGNAAARGGAIYATQPASAQISNAAFWNDRATLQGGGLYLDGAVDVDLRYATFLDNQATDGGAAYLGGVEARVTDTIFASSRAGYAVSGAFTGAPVVAFDRCAWSTNTPGDLGGGLSSVVPTASRTDAPEIFAYQHDGDCGNDAPWLASGAALADAADPAAEDPDGTPADLGAWGGPDADPAAFEDLDGDGLPARWDCDDQDASVEGTTEWFADLDGDGHPGDLASVWACAPPAGYSIAPDDCDDGDGDVFPGAPESCTAATDADCDGHAGSADDDGDGTLACDDCDDDDGTIHPGADESCDGIDEDCDGVVDNDAADATTPFWPDGDGDGYGTNGDPVVACRAPGGHAPRSGDCDDDAPDVHPDAVEACDGTVDADCDGNPGSVDADSDGYAGCVDCDDGDAAVHPAADDVCDGADNDCDGATDEDIHLGAAVYADADGDGFGDPQAAWLGCEPPAGYVAAPTDCDDADAAIYPGADEVPADDIDQDCDGADGLGDTDAEPRACGCTSAGSPTAGAAWLLLAAGITRRRSSRATSRRAW